MGAFMTDGRIHTGGHRRDASGGWRIRLRT
jgi:hypothetical protein